jgi:ferredoxin-NADP reductase
MAHSATLLMSGFVTYDTKRFVLTKPEGFTFEPGQGVELTLDRPEWHGQGHPFTPTSRREDQVLEFTIKRYPERQGFTDTLHRLTPGECVTLSDPFGTIRYQGPGVFIAAGAGVTPFLSILRRLAADNMLEGQRLLFSNKTRKDLICGLELRHYLGDACVFTFTRERDAVQHRGHIDTAFLEGHIGNLDQYFYVCGPDPFVESVNGSLAKLGVTEERLVYER